MMKAMILAAGFGKRMHPLTLETPKPLLKVADKYLIAMHLEKLAAAGFSEVVINTHWLAEQLPSALGDGERWGLHIYFSHEPELLETAGGIRQALPLLVNSEDEAFLLLNGDVYFEWDLEYWLKGATERIKTASAYLALVPNPEHHPNGDFLLNAQSAQLGLPGSAQAPAYTYSGIGLFTGRFFSQIDKGYAPLGPLLKQAISDHQVKGDLQHDFWLDVGTIDRLQCLQERLSKT